MFRTMNRSLLLLAVGLFAACSSSSTPDSGTDTGTSDSGGVDSGGLDSGDVDSGSMDSSLDSGVADSSADSMVVDSGMVDSTRPDAGMCVDPPAGESRPVAWECSDCRLPGAGGSRGECATDADCTAGDNGRCNPARIGGMCSYDECFKDEDCADTELCACDGGFGGGNACIEAACRVDADCGAYDCSPTLGSCGHYFPPVGYYCHTATDACYSDADCAGGYCAYDPTSGAWACSTAECVG